MKSFLSKLRTDWAFVAVLFTLVSFLPSHADAQTAARQPFFAATNTWIDAGNGPIELLAVEGSAVGYVSSGGLGVTGTSTTTALTLSGTPAIPPCIGCSIQCSPINAAFPCTIPAGTVVTAFNGTTGVTTSVATTTTAASLVWGAACPTSGTPTAPSAAGNTLSPPLNLRAAVGATGAGLATPVGTAGRVCVYGGQQQGGTVVSFPIGAW